ncbi:MAG: class B sortase [Bacilli bacterium]|nr:class B sortase [Bacilli bacterium]
MEKQRKNKLLKYLLILVIPIVFTLVGYYLYDKYVVPKKIAPSAEKIIKEKAKNNYVDKDEKVEVVNYVNELPNYRAQYNNQYIMGKLTIPQLNIDALVTRAANNEYYLNYNYYNQRDGLGVPFFDYRNTDLVNDRQINIYGHNTRNTKYYDELPFINLEAYLDENIFNNYKTAYLSIDEKQIEFEVIAIKIITNADNEHMKLVFYNDNDFIQHSAKLLSNTLYSRDDDIKKTDRLLVLQVCHYNPEGSYLLVICKEVV